MRKGQKHKPETIQKMSESQAKRKPRKWYYNTNTLEETFYYFLPGKDWKEGRLPYEYWSDERKESYRSKRQIAWNRGKKCTEEQNQRKSFIRRALYGRLR